MNANWTEVLRTNQLFSGMTDTLLGHLNTALEERRLPAGAELVRKGDEADHLFVIVDGKLDVFLDDLRLHELGPGSIVGEVALLAGGKRSATVRAIEPTHVLMLSRERFDRLVEQYPELASAFSTQVQQRMRRVRIAPRLEELFGKLDADTIADIEASVTWKRLAGGEVLFRQGDPADGAYIVAFGRLRVSFADGTTERVIDEVGAGQWIGEMALLTRSSRSATVYAVRDSELVWLPQAVFERLVMQRPQALLEATRLLVVRLQRQMGGAPRDITSNLRTLAIIPTSANVDVQELAQKLAAELEPFGSVLYLTSERVDAELGKAGIARARDGEPGHLRLTPWLAEQETAHRYVIYQADREWTPWSARVARSADRIVLVANGDDSSAPSAVEQELSRHFTNARAPKQTLVLLHKSRGPGFPGTAQWIKQRPGLDNHFHVRRGNAGDVARVARILDNRAIGVVLGGGGSRGYAHIGVLRAFEELGIPIDAIGGSSIGAVIAGARALELDSKQIVETCVPIMAGFFDPTLPFVSLMAGKRATLDVENVAKNLDIEDIIIPYFAISTNLTRGGSVVHRTGPAGLAARASGSVPGIFPPVPWNGDLLVDGGLTNNLPVDVMKSFVGGSVVAVDVIPDVDLQATDDMPSYLSGWAYAWKKVNPFASKGGSMPNILSILFRSVMVASKDVLRAEEKLTALYLRPAVKKWNMLDFKSAGPLADQGYRTTIDQIRTWWSTARAAHIGARP